MADTVMVVTGPTATGKTALSVAVARALNGEIISADSMQIYRGMDIGTAKVTAAEMQGVAHHMIDVAAPTEVFSAARWVEMAAACVSDIFARGKMPIIAGGTNLYIDSLLAGRDFAAGPEDPAVRAALSAEYDEKGGSAMLEALRTVDPLRAEKLHPADKKRVCRALEVYRLTGKTITQHDLETQARPPRWPSVRFALTFADRQMLYDCIDRRVDAMCGAGLFREVRGLMDAGLDQSSTAMQAIGYKESAAYLSGVISREEAVARIKQESRRYAKRQLTWLRRDHGLHWITWAGAPDIPGAAARICACVSGQPDPEMGKS